MSSRRFSCFNSMTRSSKKFILIPSDGVEFAGSDRAGESVKLRQDLPNFTRLIDLVFVDMAFVGDIASRRNGVSLT